jgi:O-antigen ligase
MAIQSGQALAVGGAIGPTLAVFSPKAMAPLFFMVAVVELSLFWYQRRRLPRPPWGGTVLLAVFVLWGALGALWSLDSAASLDTAGKLAIMAALGLPLLSVSRDLSSAARHVVLRSTAGGVSAGLVVLAIEAFFQMPITHLIYAALGRTHSIYPSMLNPAATVLVLLAGIVAGELLYGKHVLGALLVGTAAVVLAVASESMAAGVAGVIAAVVLAAIYWGGAALGRALGAVVALAILAAPLFPSRVLGPAQEFQWPSDAIPSVYQRIAIWKFTAARIDERPVLGWGLDAARRIPGGHDGIKATSLNIQNPVMRERVTKYFNSGNIEQMPLHPHNAALQIWLETGGVGAVLIAALVLLALLATVRCRPTNRPGSAGAFAAGIAALAIAGLSYGLWQTWWLASLWLAAVFAAALVGRSGEDESSAG